MLAAEEIKGIKKESINESHTRTQNLSRYSYLKKSFKINFI